MAELYRTLSKDVMNSERPKGMKGDELEEYNSLLEEQVFPFEEQAIKAHEINTARAKDGVYDEWVQKSFQGAGGIEAGALRQDGNYAGCRDDSQLRLRVSWRC